jgi:hypothetical protein
LGDKLYVGIFNWTCTRLMARTWPFIAFRMVV